MILPKFQKYSLAIRYIPTVYPYILFHLKKMFLYYSIFTNGCIPHNEHIHFTLHFLHIYIVSYRVVDSMLIIIFFLFTVNGTAFDTPFDTDKKSGN